MYVLLTKNDLSLDPSRANVHFYEQYICLQVWLLWRKWGSIFLKNHKKSIEKLQNFISKCKILIFQDWCERALQAMKYLGGS